VGAHHNRGCGWGREPTAAAAVGFAVGGDHGLVDGPGRFDLDVLVTVEQVLEAVVLFVGEQVDAGVQHPPRAEQRVAAAPAGYTGIVGPRWERWFGLMAQAARVLMGTRANLAAIQLISASQDRLQKVAGLVEPKNKELASSIRAEFADRGTDRNEVLAWTGAKFQRLLGTPHLRAMIEKGADALRLDQRITQRSIVLADLAMPPVGVPAARTIGTIVLEQLWAAALQRLDRERPFSCWWTRRTSLSARGSAQHSGGGT
jgi:hypothetical protein